MPPRLAPIQAVIVPILSKKARDGVLAAARALAETLRRDLRVKLDDREEYSPGWKYNEWEMRGVPVRIEMGPRDLEKDQVILVRRDTGEREAVPRGGLPARLPALLEAIQRNLFEQALKFRQAHTRSGSDYREFAEIMERERGFFLASWRGRNECEAKVKEDTRATIRCIPFDVRAPHANCLVCGRKAKEAAYLARSY